jgi:hypothetical protein
MWIPRTNLHKKCEQTMPNNISAKCLIWSVEETSSKKISMMPYIFVQPSNCSAEEMSSKQNLSDSKCLCEILDRIHMLCIYFCLTLELFHRRNVEQTKSKWFQMLLWNPRSNPRKKFHANKKKRCWFLLKSVQLSSCSLPLNP